MKKLFALLTALLLIATAGCREEGEDLPFAVSPGLKPTVSGNITRTGCYIDVNLYNPLNAGDYVIGPSRVPYFDYVILGAAQLKKDSSKGIYLYYPDSLRYVLENRRTYLAPLQKKGVRVLLGIAGGADNISFGTIGEEDMDTFNRWVNDGVTHYGLDGVEFYDFGAAASAQDYPYPAGFYPEGDASGDYIDHFTGNDGGREAAWMTGGDMMNNIIFLLRSYLPAFSTQPVLVREINYGGHLPPEVSATDFTSRDDQINFFINPYFHQFGTDPLTGGSVNANLDHVQYCPLSVNLGGDPASGTVQPPIEDSLGAGNDIYGFTERLAMDGECDYGFIYYCNLKPVSQAAAEDYLAIPSQPGARLSQAGYMSITSRAVFGSEVICEGGDRLKDW